MAATVRELADLVRGSLQGDPEALITDARSLSQASHRNKPGPLNRSGPSDVVKCLQRFDLDHRFFAADLPRRLSQMPQEHS